MPLPESLAPAHRVRAEGVRQRMSLAVHRLGFEVLARGERALAPLGIDGRDYLTLAILGTDEPDSQQDLAELAWKAPQVIVAVVDSLEQRGLVARRRAADDRRRSVVDLTPAGRELLARADTLMDDVTDAVFSALAPSERHALHDTLRRALDDEAP
ncbi:MarR family winged helix-turn-helix transcriptional regulator [Agromyces bauzanensis]|uniref:MarR family winged helix-turn-helix transcriptional regulator n=1 Tax=Agromyces bauzanensis TaxID=1308924 RepID=UPI0016670494|nr:MarR family winged helix-turn-helix transcriptional regulator [Agromyces bauzanensis]